MANLSQFPSAIGLVSTLMAADTMKSKGQ